MRTLIEPLDDTRAVDLLAAMARPRLRAGGVQTELTPELCNALAAAFDAQPAGETPSEGDLARQALAVLADDPHGTCARAHTVVGPRLGGRPLAWFVQHLGE